MNGWRKRQVMEMAKEVKMPYDFVTDEPINLEKLEALAALVRENATAEANARANASWTLMCEKMVADEREACAKMCDHMAVRYEDMRGAALESAAENIRLRGQA